MPKIKRSHAYILRGLIHETEKKIPSNDRSQIAEWERDLSANACVALWDVNIKTLLSCLRRLSGSPERGDLWSQVLGQAQGYFNAQVS